MLYGMKQSPFSSSPRLEKASRRFSGVLHGTFLQKSILNSIKNFTSKTFFIRKKYKNSLLECREQQRIVPAKKI